MINIKKLNIPFMSITIKIIATILVYFFLFYFKAKAFFKRLKMKNLI